MSAEVDAGVAGALADGVGVLTSGVGGGGVAVDVELGVPAEVDATAAEGSITMGMPGEREGLTAPAPLLGRGGGVLGERKLMREGVR